MSGKNAFGYRNRAITLGALIALGLVMLGMAVTQRSLTADGAPLQRAAPDFVVSSSRDAGPETLRDAILAADRLTTGAHILITAKRITLESALPALVNPHGVTIEAAADSGTIDAGRQETGAVLQIDSPASTLRGLHVINARAFGLIVNAPGVQIDSLTVADSKVGVLLGTAARDSTLRASTFERNETGVMAEPDIKRVSILSTIFRDNSRAGFWLVAAAEGRSDSTPAGADTERIRVRIVDSVFEGNTVGVVVANQSTLVRKSRFIRSRDSAVLILGGTARLEDSEIRTSGGAGVSVTSGTRVILARNTLVDNSSTAISVRDSDVTIEGNTLTHNGLGIVSLVSHESFAPLIRDNVITATTGDAITLIGGAAVLQRNRLTGNHGAGLRVLDLVQGSGGLKATPRLEANELKDNGSDTPVKGLYTLTGAK